VPGEILYKDLSYKIIGLCMEVHNILGKGHSEIIYKDALQHELNKAGISSSREKNYRINYKDIVLPHDFFADFVIENKIVLEVKAIDGLTDHHAKQTLNYLAASKLRLGILVNFGENVLTYRRVVL
jgi:GxxExxY protein